MTEYEDWRENIDIMKDDIEYMGADEVWLDIENYSNLKNKMSFHEVLDLKLYWREIYLKAVEELVQEGKLDELELAENMTKDEIFAELEEIIY